MLNTPYTKWQGDQLHGQRPELTPAWVQLELVYPRPSEAAVATVVDGLDVVGAVPALLSGWFRTVQGDFLGVVSYEIPYADGRPHRVRLVDQLLPASALRHRIDAPGT